MGHVSGDNKVYDTRSVGREVLFDESVCLLRTSLLILPDALHVIHPLIQIYLEI